MVKTGYKLAFAKLPQRVNIQDINISDIAYKLLLTKLKTKVVALQWQFVKARVHDLVAK